MWRLFSLTILAVTSFSQLAHASCLHGTSLLRRQVHGDKVEVSSFGYDDETGPLLWAGMNPNNTACHAGNNQSPIVLDASIPDAPTVDMTIQSVHEAEIENLGSTLEVIGLNGTTTFQDKPYFLKQFHFHTPSEHRIDSEYYPLEMHMVHESADGNFVVVAVLYEVSDVYNSEFLLRVTENLSSVQEPGSIGKTGALDLSALSDELRTKPKYHYVGSLTTPPCREGVNFLVVKEPFTVDVKTYNAMKKVMKFNARYTQNVLGRDNLLELAAAQFTQ
ncbi:hypothetical protein PQX77_006091 [Marasmius sp. AFHP31]|nr:hypothetical protein PQX77_006091 [Marasmius sp. AFHP31]